MLKKILPSTIIATFFVALLILLFGFFKGTLDIQIHDTYYVIDYNPLLLILGSLLLFKSVLVYIFQQRLIFKIALSLHLIIDILSSCFFSFAQIYSAQIPRRYYRFESIEYFFNLSVDTLNTIITYSILLYFLNQLLLVILLVMNYFLKIKSVDDEQILDFPYTDKNK